MNQIKHFSMTSIFAVLLIFAAHSHAQPFAMMGNPLEKILDHLDLTASQEAEIESIIAETNHVPAPIRHMRLASELVALDPNDPAFEYIVREKAQQTADQIESEIITMSLARQEIVNILDDDQREDLARLKAKKLKKLEKMLAKWSEDE